MNRGLLIANGFLNNERFNVLYKMFIEAFDEVEIKLDLLYNHQIPLVIDSDLSNLRKYQFILFYDKDIYLNKHLENNGFKVFNSSEAIRINDDKGFMALELEKHQIKMPKTTLIPFTFPNVLITDFQFLDHLELNFPIILKENKGSFGNEVYKVDNISQIIDIIKNKNGTSFLLQEYIEASYGVDIRVMVVNHQCIGAVKRTNNDFRSNVLAGGIMEKYLLNQELIDMATKISKILKLDFGSIDFLIDKDQYIFCEANSNVHFKTFYDVTKINLAKHIANYIKNSI